ncbi:MAG: ATP-binding protein [Sphingopyxis sp.]|nr:ATP-binding protein [Sphingopyxis sp.]
MLILLGLLLTGIMVSSLMRAYITQGFHDEMQVHIEELAALTIVDSNGQPRLLRRLSDPRFIPPNSGFYWKVERDGYETIRSPSLVTGDLSGKMAINDVPRWSETDGPTGKAMEYGMVIHPTRTKTPVKISIATDLILLEEVLSDFNWPLFYALLGFAIAMSLLGIAQITYSLKPLERLKLAIADVRTGKESRMAGSYPSEISPLVSDLNHVLDANVEMVRSARVQAANLAHGLRTPLAIMMDEAQQIAERGEKESAEVLLNGCEQMLRYVEYYTARARTAALARIPGQSTSLRKTVEPIVTAMRRLHKGKEIAICLGDFPDILLPCDSVDLEEMTSNLIDNACKWASSRVMISWEEDRQWALLYVDDDGPGLPPEEYISVFEIGERLDAAKPGSGLGLPIVKDLATLYQGRVTLSKSPLGGLRAELAIPKAYLSAE